MKQSVKDLALRVVRKGKTRGRPSKYEMYVSKIMSDLVEQNKDVISDIIADTTINGTGILRIKYKKDKVKLSRVK